MLGYEDTPNHLPNTLLTSCLLLLIPIKEVDVGRAKSYGLYPNSILLSLICGVWAHMIVLVSVGCAMRIGFLFLELT